jgi:hypothetical protein
MTELRFQAIKQKVLTILEQQLDPRLTYHNLAHTKDVMAQVERIAHGEQITHADDIMLLRVAALFHDSRSFAMRTWTISAETILNRSVRVSRKNSSFMVSSARRPTGIHCRSAFLRAIIILHLLVNKTGTPKNNYIYNS